METLPTAVIAEVFHMPLSFCLKLCKMLGNTQNEA